MVTFAAAVTFTLAVAWCAERLVHARAAAWAAIPLAVVAISWLGLWTERTPSAGRALLAFLLADVAVLVLGVLGVFRLLGAFDEQSPWSDWDDGGGSDAVVPPDSGGPAGGHALRRPPTRPVHPTRRTPRRPRPSGSSRSARGSASRGSSTSSFGRSARGRS